MTLPPASPLQLSTEAAFVASESDHDIYRGQPHHEAISDSRPVSPSSNTTSSLSSAASGRLGAFAAVVELAISRWRNPSSSSLSSSPSIATPSRSSRRRRRRSSAADRNARSERDVTARIKARQETRQVPREFSLYVPHALQTSPSETSRRNQYLAEEDSTLRTYLLPEILNRLNATLKASTKLRQQEASQCSRTPVSISTGAGAQPEAGPSRLQLLRTVGELSRIVEGKQRESKIGLSSGPPDVPNRNKGHQPAWWLDVSSPTSEDMRALGKLLHLHPLTLEDILSRDPREKLEFFPKLGYYLVVFKAIESQKTRERKGRDSPVLHDEGIIGEDLIHLIVLNGGDGLCTFHFTDISEHLDHVKHKVILLDENLNKSSEWIAHGILDSVVDSFFPFLYNIAKEVDEIEDLIFSNNVEKRTGQVLAEKLCPLELPDVSSTTFGKAETSDESAFDEKLSPARVKSVKSQLYHSFATILIYFRGAKCTITMRFRRVFAFGANKRARTSSSALTLHRMARARRLVTTLTRLLATKAELITQIRKRMMTKGEYILGSDAELYIHLGDILDHILTLQQGFIHYDRALSQSHPTYHRQLHLTAGMAKFKTARAGIILTSVSISVLSIQILIGLCSLNVTLPHNGYTPSDPYYIFGIVLAISLSVLSGCFLTVRYMWKQIECQRPIFKGNIGVS